MEVKALTENSWILLANGSEKIGLLSKSNSTGYTLLSKGIKNVFKDNKELFDFFQEDIFSNTIAAEVTKDKVMYTINGYKVDFAEAIPYDGDSTLPLFYKNNKQGVLFAAGYYCLDFPKQWQPSHCPKLLTLQTYNYEGPFKTEEEMTLVLNRRRQEKIQK